MSGIYYVDAAEWLRAVGITVVEWSPYGLPGDSWKRRARSSGVRCFALGTAPPYESASSRRSAARSAPRTCSRARSLLAAWASRSRVAN